jgi:hypothetical protein
MISRSLFLHAPLRRKPHDVLTRLLDRLPADTPAVGPNGPVAQLEARISRLLGKEAALFFPSGTMAQQVALRVHAERRGRTAFAGNTFFWDPVSGCENQQVAESRAWALVRGGGGAEGTERADFWARKAQEIIRCYLMAAAIQGWDMGAVAHWANNPDDLTPVNILEAHPP